MKWTVDPTHSSVEFTVRHMSLTSIRGRFTRFEGEGRTNSAGVLEWLKVTIETASLDTAEPQRDAHLRSDDFFAADTFPIILFESTDVQQIAPDRFTVNGLLTMHGVTKPLSFSLTTTNPLRDPWGNLRVGAQAQSALRRKEWGLVWNQLMDFGGMMISDDVWFNISVQVIPESDPQYRVRWELNKPEDKFHISLAYKRERLQGHLTQVKGSLELLNGRLDSFQAEFDTTRLVFEDTTLSASRTALLKLRQTVSIKASQLQSKEPGVFVAQGELSIERFVVPVTIEIENMQLQIGTKCNLSARVSIIISVDYVAELAKKYYFGLADPTDIRLISWFVCEVIQANAQMKE